jgi:hypothetical protein
MCRDLGLFLHSSKCELFARETTFCGLRLSSAGTTFDPRRLAALRTMSLPLSGGDIQQFVCALGWMRKGIPDYARRIKPLQSILEEAYHQAGGRTRRHASRVRLSSTAWGPTHALVFRELQQHRLIQLAHFDSRRRLCLYADASSTGWAAVLTQVPTSDLHLPHADRDHQPLAFLGGCFRGASCNWSVIEKEAFALIRALTSTDYFCQTEEGVIIYTDHRNLVFLFAHWVLSPACIGTLPPDFSGGVRA